MAAKTPGLNELNKFVDVIADAGIDAGDGKEQYALASKLLIAAYEIHAEQFKRKPRSDAGSSRKED